MKLKQRLSKSSVAEVDTLRIGGCKNNNIELLDLDSGKSYRLLKILSNESKYDLTDSTKKLVTNYYKINPQVQRRNTSILAHGLRPLNKMESEQLYKLVLNHSKKLCINIENEMEMAEFPQFKGD